MDNMVNLYKTRTMLGAVENIPTNESFLIDTFCGASETFPTSSIDIDFVKGKKKMSPFVSKYVNGIQVERNVVATKNYEPAKIQPSRVLTVETLEQRLAGEALYSNKTPAQRAADLLEKDLFELKSMNKRRKEWIVAQSLFNGKYIAKVHIDKDNTVSEDFDFGHTFATTVAKKWSVADSDPIADLLAESNKIAASCGQRPSIVVMNDVTAEAFLNNAKVQAIFDKWNINIGTIQPSVKSTQVQYIGRLLRPAVEIYTYAESYVDEEGATHTFVPDGKVLIACPKIFSFKYAAHTQMENKQFVTYMGEDIPKYDAVDSENVAKLTLTSKPVPVPFDVDAWATLSVL